MFYINSVVYVKNGKETVSYVKEDNFVAIVKAQASEEDLLAFLYSILDELNAKPDLSLEDLDRAVSEAISRFNLPLSLDLALGFLKEDRFLIKTMGEGVIFGLRGEERGKIISGNKSAVGKIQPGDWFVLGFGDMDEELIFSPVGKNFEETSNAIHNLQEHFVALYATIESLKESSGLSLPKVSAAKFPRINLGFNKRFIQVVVGIVILLILAFSVYSGYEKKQKEKVLQLVSETQSRIEKKLSQAEEIAFLSPDKAEQLFNEAKEEVAKVKQEIPEKYLKETESLDRLLAEKERIVFKEFSKNLEEFYDLNLLYPQAKALSFRLFQDKFVILTANNKIYELGIEDKKQTELGEVKEARFVDGYEDGVVVFNGQAVVLVNQDVKKELVTDDDAWKQIVDFSVYGKNLYLLDSGANQIFKHTPVENGFSSAIPYLKGEFDFSSQAKLAIDGNIFVADKDKIYKFFKGNKQDFIFEIPVSGYTFDLLFTSPETDYLYLADKSNSKIYVLSKETGELIEQITNQAIRQALSIAVYKGKVYLLTETRIYSLK